MNFIRFSFCINKDFYLFVPSSKSCIFFFTGQQNFVVFFFFTRKWHVLPFIGELGGSSQDVDSTILGLKENPEEIPISELVQPEDVEASNFDSAPAGSTHARNARESGAL